MITTSRSEQERNVIVIGGGLAGLACAVALSDRGRRVTVLERSPRLGGRAASWTEQATGDTVDIGPHILHSEYRNFLALLERLGTSRLICWQPDPVLTLATKSGPLRLRHRLLPPPLSLMPSMMRAPGLSPADLLSMTRLTWQAVQFGEEQVDELDRIPADEFFRQQGVTERMIDWWWRFAAMVVTNVPLERCSAASLMRIHAHLSGYRDLHFGFARVGLGELYCMQAARAIEAAGGKVSTSVEVKGLLGTSQAEGVVLADGSTVRAPHVVSTVPPQALAPLVPEHWRSQQPFSQLGMFEPSPYISCYLWFDRPLGMERFTSHLFSPARLNYDFYDLSQIRAGWRGRPTVTASNIIYSHRAQGLSDDEVIAATVRELAEFAPAAGKARVAHAQVHRIPMAIPCPVVGFERARPPACTPVPGLVLAGDWTRTHLPCSMEGAAKSGWTAAEQVLAAAGCDVRLAREPRGYDGIGALVRPVAAWPGDGGAGLVGPG
jgi:squalene-associated FAD-dependent desaturase